MSVEKKADNVASAVSWRPDWESTGSPLVYQLNVRVLLSELAVALGRHATLDDIPNSLLVELAAKKFDFVYLLGVWSTGAAGLEAARRFMSEHHPTVARDDVTSSPFAICDYQVDPDFGGDASLGLFRNRLRAYELGLLLDFVPNHVAFDHPWASASDSDNPKNSLILPGNKNLLHREPQNYFLVVAPKSNPDNRQVMQGDHGVKWLSEHSHELQNYGVAVLAHGRDPHFDGWRDTAQLNYFNERLRVAMITLLKKVCSMCDGIRCDMANLIANNILHKTWGDRYREAIGGDYHLNEEFWSKAIREVLAVNSSFKFIAEVYWNMEGQLMQQGFHFCYDKELYDYLRQGDVHRMKTFLRQANAEHQRRLTRFIENHDEDRAASIYPDIRRHRAAAVIAFTSLGMKFIHMGQLEGRVARIPMQLKRFADCDGMNEARWFRQNVEHVDKAEIPARAADMYRRLLPLLSKPSIKHGKVYFPEVHPSSCGSKTHECIVAYFRLPSENCQPNSYVVLVVVNYSDAGADGWVKFPSEVFQYRPSGPNKDRPASLMNEFGGVGRGNSLVLSDCVGSVDAYRKDADAVRREGVWFGLQPYQTHAFELIWK